MGEEVEPLVQLDEDSLVDIGVDEDSLVEAEDSLVDVDVDEDSLVEVEDSLLDESIEVVDESTLVVVESDDELSLVVAF